MDKNVTTPRIPSISSISSIPDVSMSVDICYVARGSGSVRDAPKPHRPRYAEGELRPCTKCGKLLPRTPDFYSADKRSSDGLDSWCRDCKRANALRWNENHRERARANGRSHYKQNKVRYHRLFRAWEQAHPLAKTARYYVKKALASGRMVMPDTCDVCLEGSVLVVHHQHYNRPLWGMTVCLSCHKKEHGCQPQLPSE